MRLENQIPGMNLQMSISAKVDDIMIKIADYSVKWSNVCCISSLFEILSQITKLFNLFTMAAILEAILDLYFSP